MSEHVSQGTRKKQMTDMIFLFFIVAEVSIQTIGCNFSSHDWNGA